MLISGVKQKRSDSNPFKLHVSRFGNGDQPILAFHGFGQEGSVYREFEKIVDGTFQIHAFDLPFHGKSSMNLVETGVNKELLKDFFEAYFKLNGISSFILVGYSIGAKFTLNLVNFFPEKVNRLILIAPDGLRINFWYRLATGTSISRRIFRFFMEHPGLFVKFTDLLAFLKLIHPSVGRFAKSQMSDKQNRQLIYDSWVNYRTLNIDIHQLGKVIDLYQIPVEIFLGEKDRVISTDAVKPLIREFHHIKVHVLPVGHSRLIEDTAAYYKREGF
jgi:pimeloyl-ACP methyl ester carboxylesterase